MFEVITLTSRRSWTAAQLRDALQDDPLLLGIPMAVDTPAELGGLLERDPEPIQRAVRKQGIWKGKDVEGQPVLVLRGEAPLRRKPNSRHALRGGR
jgi:hypothetical protein